LDLDIFLGSLYLYLYPYPCLFLQLSSVSER
jgi:hypothetical protein